MLVGLGRLPHSAGLVGFLYLESHNLIFARYFAVVMSPAIGLSFTSVCELTMHITTMRASDWWWAQLCFVSDVNKEKKLVAQMFNETRCEVKNIFVVKTLFCLWFQFC